MLQIPLLFCVKNPVICVTLFPVLEISRDCSYTFDTEVKVSMQFFIIVFVTNSCLCIARYSFQNVYFLIKYLHLPRGKHVRNFYPYSV